MSNDLKTRVQSAGGVSAFMAQENYRGTLDQPCITERIRTAMFSENDTAQRQLLADALGVIEWMAKGR